jgi:hypothetical protein
MGAIMAGGGSIYEGLMEARFDIWGAPLFAIAVIGALIYLNRRLGASEAFAAGRAASSTGAPA